MSGVARSKQPAAEEPDEPQQDASQQEIETGGAPAEKGKPAHAGPPAGKGKGAKG